jgi:DNA invertase Pin-like site-specific DNA recombinase
MTTFGYARVSTDGQTLAAQDAALHAAGCAKVFSEKASGAKTDRAELRKAISRLGDADVLMVTRLDRVGQVDPRPAQHPRRDHQTRRGLQVAGR